METVKLVGILNITPDSFSDGGQFLYENAALQQAKKLFDEGADLVDVGGESTKPRASVVEPSEEWNRIKDVIRKLLKEYPGKISLDTRHPETAERFLQFGGTILNDVSGFRDPKMIELAAKYKPVCIVNHFPGKDPTEVHTKRINDVNTVVEDLLNRKKLLVSAGIAEDKMVLDPGIGFGKTQELNYKLIEFARLVKDSPVMIGYSRKRFLGEDRFKLEPNLEAGQRAIDSGASYLRVHEIRPYRNLRGKSS